MKRIYFTYLLLVSITLFSFGQKNKDDQYDGYVITQDDIMIKGYLEFVVGNAVSGKKILLYKQRNFSPREFYTLELNGYAYKKDTFRIFNNLQPYLDEDKFIERAVAKVVQSGKLVLYKINETNYAPVSVATVAPGGMTTMAMSQTSNIYIVCSPIGELIGIKPENFKEEINKLLYDAPDLLEQIDGKVLRFKHLEKIIEQYNARF